MAVKYRAEEYLPLEPFQMMALVIYGLAILVGTAEIVSLQMQVNLLERIGQGEDLHSNGEADANDARVNLISYVDIGLTCLAGVALLAYLYRAAHNAWFLAPRSLENTPGWAVGYWFVPFVNLYKPYVIMQECWVAASLHNDQTGKNDRSTFLGVWWFVHIVASLSGNFVRRMSEGKTIPDLIAFTHIACGHTLLCLVLNVMTVYLILKFTARMNAKRDDPNRAPAEGQRTCADCGELFSAARRCPMCGSTKFTESVTELQANDFF